MKKEEQIRFLTREAEKLYTFVFESYTLYSAARDYGNGEKMTMAEIHTLTLIADHPGISVGGVADMWNRTLSAASQNIQKLAQKGLIEKKKEEGNGKTVHLYATEEGKTLSERHKDYDRRQLTVAAEEMLRVHSFAELQATLRVMESGILLMEKIQNAEEKD